MKFILIIFLLSAVLSVILGKITIPLLKKLKFGQTILSYVTEHKTKNGTPTMGGLFFILASVIIFYAFCSKNNYLSTLSITIILAFMIVGFIDDFIKIKNKQNLGLTAKQKVVFQVSISLIASVFAYKNGFDFLYLPFTKNTIYLGVFSILLNAIVFISTVNAVNLTDGLDGLSASVSFAVFLTLAVIITLEIGFNNSTYVSLNEYKNLSNLCVCLSGSLLGYLVFNTSKASVFMGDTGSLAIGGGIASISIFSGNTLYIPVIGITFVLSVISVIIQVIHYKRTKNRVFLMAPLHHHFQHKGYSESKISFCYFFVTVIISITCLISLL